MENYQNTNEVPEAPIETPLPVKKSKVFIINILIFIVYYLIAFFLIKSNGELVLLLGLYIPHTIILFILSFIRFFKGQFREAALYAFTAIALVVIGFGACAVPFFTGIINIEM